MLDIDLYDPESIRETPDEVFVNGPALFWANITHNLYPMASAAGLNLLWNPWAADIVRAEQLIQPLQDGLERLRAEPDRFGQLTPTWGRYEDLEAFVVSLLDACRTSPDALVRVSL